MSSPRIRVAALSALAHLCALAVSPAAARCEQPSLITTWESPTVYSYIYTPGVAPTPQVSSSMTPQAVGHFWTLGFGDPSVGIGLDHGTFPAVSGQLDGWLDLPHGFPASILTTWADDAGIDACFYASTADPICTAILLSDNTAGNTFFSFLLSAESASRDFWFNRPGNAPIVLAPIPVPDVVASDGNFATVASPVLPEAGFHLDPACGAGPADVVVGYKIYWYRQVPGGPPPVARQVSDDPSQLHGFRPAWGGVSPDGTPLPLGTDARIEVACQPWDIYLATSLVLDSGYETDYVSSISRVFPACECTGVDGDGDGYCTGVDGMAEDCDDHRATTFPGAPALCDGLNNDCVDAGWPSLPRGELDFDGDGFPQCADCDDEDDRVFQGAPQVCDGIDNTCGDGLPTDEVDFDGDGVPACAGDCEPMNASIYPGAPQVCDNRNNDCDHPRWPEIAGSEDFDNDGDGIRECAGDCWDYFFFGTVPGDDIYPGAPELCDGVANDCDHPDWPAPTVEAEDADHDGDGFRVCSEADCDDRFAAVFPGAPEQCDRMRNDCNHPSWPDLPEDERDHDGDGITECEGDCAPFNGAVYPGAPQICDGFNNDCNHPDWPIPLAGNGDADGDGSPTCADCDDLDRWTYAGAPGRCDGVNNDCSDPEWPALPFAERDDDGDGFPACFDCNAQDHKVYPGAPEVCDGLANDCDYPNWPTPPPGECANCGNGRLDEGETCDPPGQSAGVHGNPCRTFCTVCGDGVLDAGEGCDDGNQDDDDDCHDDCTIAPGSSDEPMVLLSFTASAERVGVRIRWSTNLDRETRFVLLRARGGRRRPEIISLQPIPALGGAAGDTSYEFLDTDRQAIDGLHYWLEGTDVDGNVNRFGPIAVSPRAPSQR